MRDLYSKTKIVPVLAITSCFVAAFFVLRALPDAECGFLHYIEIVNEDGEIELCATNHAGFLDLSVLKYPINITLTPDQELRLGEVQQVDLDLKTEGGMPIASHELALTHTKKMHVMLIDPSLEDYHHVHPKSDGFDGHYQFAFTPKRSGDYRVFTEVVPSRSRRQAIATGLISVDGAPEVPSFSRSTESEVDGARFALTSVPARLKTGRDYQFGLVVNDSNGQPAQLEAVMGALGHMVAFDAQGHGFAHMHPINSLATAATGTHPDPNESRLEFMFNVPNPGWYRLFAQVQIDGRAVFGRFDIEVE
ncbi:MAG: hypothetical protein ACPGIC_02390 [Opitutales bacterium]